MPAFELFMEELREAEQKRTFTYGLLAGAISIGKTGEGILFMDL